MAKKKNITKKIHWEFPVVAGISGWTIFNQKKGLKRINEDAIRFAAMDILMSKKVNFDINFDIDKLVSAYCNVGKNHRPLQADILIYRKNTKHKDSFIEMKTFFGSNPESTSKINIAEDILRLSLCRKEFKTKSYFLVTGYNNIIQKVFTVFSDLLIVPEWGKHQLQDKKGELKLSEFLDSFAVHDKYKKALKAKNIKIISTEVKAHSFAGGKKNNSMISTILWDIKPFK